MSYKGRIKHLEEMHKLLDKQINEMQTNHPHVDEPHLAELKKKKLQLKDEIRDAVLGNAGSIVSFRISPEDTEIMVKAFVQVQKRAKPR